jgi:hypothetical protein
VSTAGDDPRRCRGGASWPLVDVIRRLSEGLIALQKPDGGYDLGAGGEYNFQIERIASSALATAALAQVRRLGPEVKVEGLDAALARGLDFLRKQQIETGPIGHSEPKDQYSQIDATSAGILAFFLAGRADDAEALRRAAVAMRRFSRGGLRNGYTRAAATMAMDRVARLAEFEKIFDRPLRRIVDIRPRTQASEKSAVLATEWNVAEAIARVVLGLRKGRDPFPAQVVVATLEDLPVWSHQSSDCQAWWMQAWLVARSGAEEAETWFHDLLTVLQTEAIGEAGTIPGGWYANTLSQTAGAILALCEGFGPEVIYRK